MTEAEIIDWIEKNDLAAAPYDGITKQGVVDGYDVYEIDYTPDEDGDLPWIGLSCFILVKDKEIKAVFGEETYEIMHKLEEEQEELKNRIPGDTLIYSYRCEGTMLPEYDYLKLYESGKVVLESGSTIDSRKESKKESSIPKEKASEIKTIICESRILDIDKLEDDGMLILDGVEDTLYFSDGKKKKMLGIDNFGIRRRTKNIENYPNLALLTKTYRAIKRILLSSGIDKNYC